MQGLSLMLHFAQGVWYWYWSTARHRVFGGRCYACVLLTCTPCICMNSGALCTAQGVKWTTRQTDRQTYISPWEVLQ